MLIRAIILALLCVVPTRAQVAVESRTTEAGGVKVALSNVGMFGWNVQERTSECTWPRDSTPGFILGGGLFIGAWYPIADSFSVRVLPGYDPLTMKSWFTPESPVTIERTGNMERLTATFSDRDTSRYQAGVRPEDISGLPMGLSVTQSLTTWADGDSSNLMLLTSTVRNVHPTRVLQQCLVSHLVAPEMRSPPGLVALARRGSTQFGYNVSMIQYRLQQGVNTTPAMMIGMIEGPFAGKLGSVFPFTRSDYVIWLHEGRWGGMTANSLSQYGQMTFLSAVPTDLFPGDSIVTSMLFSFDADSEEETVDRALRRMFEFKGLAVSAHEYDPDDHLAVSVHPNPTDGATMITLSSMRPVDRVVIVDHVGRIVESVEHESVIPVSRLSAGIYFLHCHIGADLAVVPVHVLH